MKLEKLVCMSAFCWFVGGALKHYCFSASATFLLLLPLTSGVGGKKWISLSFAISLLWLVWLSLKAFSISRAACPASLDYLLALNIQKIKPAFCKYSTLYIKSVLLLFRFVMCYGLQLYHWVSLLLWGHLPVWNLMFSSAMK